MILPPLCLIVGRSMNEVMLSVWWWRILLPVIMKCFSNNMRNKPPGKLFDVAAFNEKLLLFVLCQNS